MQNKTALIVDDSRTASQMLRLLLEREQFQVDVLGSAEDAIGYLQDHRPGIIFMDHIMPGMDGFQAVKEIKNSSVTSVIPIVMYTAKSGDLYVGQAHALGAVDILPKPPTKETLLAVFRRLDRTEVKEPAPVAEAPPPPAVDSVESAITNGMTEITTRGDSAVTRPAERLPVTAAPNYLPATPPQSQVVDDGGPRVPWWMAAAAVVAAFVGGMQFSGSSVNEANYWQTVAWSINEGLEYPYGEWPFAGKRVALVQGLVERLAAAGFKGTVLLEGHTGAYCLVSGPGGWRLPEASRPIDACEIIGLPDADARQVSGLQSPEFRDLIQKSPLLVQTGISVQIGAKGIKEPRHAYPTPEQVASVGDWNRIAAENNRITVSLIPAS